jgi:hypothetical protein
MLSEGSVESASDQDLGRFVEMPSFRMPIVTTMSLTFSFLDIKNSIGRLFGESCDLIYRRLWSTIVRDRRALRLPNEQLRLWTDYVCFMECERL